MNRIPMIVNGLPGNVAATVTRHAALDNRFDLVALSLTGPEITDPSYRVDDVPVRLFPPDRRDAFLSELKGRGDKIICVDFTHPASVNENARFYCENSIPFVMGTTGGDREMLADTVKSSNVPVVIAPNMAKQIVGFQAMMEWAAKTFPGLFSGYSLSIRESHQRGKADTSGTAKAMVRYFNELGAPFKEDEIEKERDPQLQQQDWGIPEEHLNGHAWHTYTLTSPDETVTFSFTHNVNGREIYGLGTLDAVAFLAGKIRAGEKGGVYSMIDVLKGEKGV